MRAVPLLAFLLCLASAVSAAPDPALAKLVQVADLTVPEFNQVVSSYRDLQRELKEIGPQAIGRKTVEQRNLIVNANKRHRAASLEYLRPNQYRRWMAVAGRQLRTDPSGPAHSYASGYGLDQGESPATAMSQAALGN